MNRKTVFIIAIVSTTIAFVLGFYYRNLISKYLITNSTIQVPKTTQRPLDKYTIDNLSKIEYQSGIFEITEELSKNELYSSYKFFYQFDADLDGKLDKKTSGAINLPNNTGLFPLILMFRGYVDQKIYTTGMGTKNAAGFFAQNQTITIAPDFLGYADSDGESSNILESRFQTYVTAISLFKYFEGSKTISFEDKIWEISNIFIWGHSNGGQIALTLLETTKTNTPAVLWAPVSKPFPYSILYYTDESEDRGKLIRGKLAEFEQDYDVEKYSLTNYLTNINAPIEIHQGSEDDAVPISWTNDLYQILIKNDLEVNYFTYPLADHNLQPNWDTAIKRSLDFYQKYLQNKTND